jgi:hypothetical protein
MIVVHLRQQYFVVETILEKCSSVYVQELVAFDLGGT